MGDALPLPRPPALVDELLTRARRRLRRLTAVQAWEALHAGALLVDIRPEHYRRREGEIPGSLVLERNVLEWRLDPTSAARIPEAAPELCVVIVCNEGYASSLAAAGLHEVGVSRATDLEAGFRAWRAAGLPTVSGATPEGQWVRAAGS